MTHSFLSNIFHSTLAGKPSVAQMSGSIGGVTSLALSEQNRQAREPA
jgi:hypothetical protein